MYDIIIIGAGPAGLSAAIYGQRAGKKTLLLDEKGFGGQILNTPEVENYPGIKKVSGFELASTLYEQATGHGAEIAYEKAVAIEDGGSTKIVRTETNTYEAKAVIIATGAKNRPLGLASEAKFTGSGVSYCATCDGAFFRGKTVAVIGGGNTALEDAEVLSALAEKVYLVHRRDTFRGEQAGVKRLLAKDNVEFVLDSVPSDILGDMTVSGLKIKNVKTEEEQTLEVQGVFVAIGQMNVEFVLDSVPSDILGDMTVSGLKIKNVKTEEEQTLEVQGVFVAIGQMPDNEAFADAVDLDPSGYVDAGEDCLTKTPGVFTAGDCRTKKVRQLATAAADGAAAALAAAAYINNL